MYTTLAAIKSYCRVDIDDDDALLSAMGETAENQIADILRTPLEDVAQDGALPPPVETAVCYLVAQMYDHRDGYDAKTSLDMARRIVFGYRREVF